MEPTREGQAVETVGKRLRRLRLERRLSQRELSSPGVSYAYISRIEAGSRQPSVKALRMLARKLNVSVEYLESGRDLSEIEERELRIAEAELDLRLTGNTAATERALEELLPEALKAGDAAAAARARVALGLAAYQRGDNHAAAARLEQALASSPIPPHTRPDLYATLGRAYSALRADDKAVALFEDCLAQVTEQAPDDLSAQVRFATYLSYALCDVGDFARAAQVVRDALEHAGPHTDPYTRVRLYWSMARLHGMEGEPAMALGYVRRAIALLEAADDTHHLAKAHLLCADLMISQGNATQAVEQLELAEQLFAGHAEPIDAAMVRINQANAAALLGDGSTAVARASEALEGLGDSFEVEQGRALAALARGHGANGEIDACLDACRRAVELLGRSRQWREASQIASECGKLLRAAGRERDALDVLEQATAFAVRGRPAEARAE